MDIYIHTHIYIYSCMSVMQSNECGGSYHMEQEGLSRSVDMLQAHGLAIDKIVTDRHR